MTEGAATVTQVCNWCTESNVQVRHWCAAIERDESGWEGDCSCPGKHYR